MVVLFYISGHGFGHAARQIELMRALRALSPEIGIRIRTSSPRWMFDAAAPRPFQFEVCHADTGVVQQDTLHVDERQTVAAATDFYRRFDLRIADEADALRQAAVDLVVGDVPPLAFAAASRARIPSIAVANFTWDWIYQAYDGFSAGEACDVIPTIQHAYSAATMALRLPLHGGFDSMAAVEDIPFIARKSHRDPADTLRHLGLDRSRPILLASFGRYGADLPLDQMERSGKFWILAPPREAPAGLRYEDLVAAADVVISKPGYGIVSECIANGAALLYTSRGRFIEYDVFVKEMPALLRCRYLSQKDLAACRWADGIDALLSMPAPDLRPPVNGASVAARRILDALN
jgi:hypothetical protein